MQLHNILAAIKMHHEHDITVRITRQMEGD